MVEAGLTCADPLEVMLCNIVGGRSSALQETMKKMREEALANLQEEASRRGANAVVRVAINFDEYSEGMLLLTISGTAVEV